MQHGHKTLEDILKVCLLGQQQHWHHLGVKKNANYLALAQLH